MSEKRDSRASRSIAGIPIDSPDDNASQTNEYNNGSNDRLGVDMNENGGYESTEIVTKEDGAQTTPQSDKESNPLRLVFIKLSNMSST